MGRRDSTVPDPSARNADRTDLDAALTKVRARVALERARGLAPFIFLIVVCSLFASSTAGVPVSGSILAINLLVIVVFATVTVALRLRRVPAAAAHAALAILWIGPVGATLVAAYSSGVQPLNVLFVLELCAGALMVSWRWLVACYAVATICWIPFALQGPADGMTLYIGAVCTAQTLAIVIQQHLRRSLVRDEVQRIALEDQVAELRRAEEDRERLRDQFVHAQRLEAVGTLAAGLAHDMNNILAAVINTGQLLTDRAVDDEMRADLEQICNEASRGAELTRGLLAFSRRGRYRLEPITITAVLAEVLPMLTRTLPKTMSVSHDVASGLAVEGDSAQLAQVIVNLCINAADAMNGSGVLVIRAAESTVEEPLASTLGIAPQKYVHLSVTDTGCGMDEATRKRVFEPFFTTKPRGKGTGLGLAMVYGAIHAHHGAITVESELGAGTTFSIYLPSISVEARARWELASTDRTRRIATVLVVDDEAVVRRSTMRILQRMGFEVLAAPNGLEAIHLFDKHPGIGLVVLDMGMPVMGGAECFRQLRERSAVPVLIATGYAADADTQAMLAQGATRLIEKPFMVDELTRRVRELLPAE